jgi:7-cyano-7-deazaguanine reductase
MLGFPTLPLPARLSRLPERKGEDKAARMTEPLTQLGHVTPRPTDPDAAVLERVANPHPDDLYLVRFTQPEFTSLCPITGQPDFAHLVIDYAPGPWLVESKSLKLYLASFRNHGAFHEDCTLAVAKKMIAAAEPRWLRIGGYWYPRGGMPIDVFWQTGPAPEGLWLPDQGVAPYRGRG